MHRNIRIFAVLLIALFMCSCHRAVSGENFLGGATPPPVPESPIKVRVAEVTNDTHQVYDIDVIGLLWNGMEIALKKRGMLWLPGMGGQPKTIVGHVVKFSKGSAVFRWIPFTGDTILEVRCTVYDGDRQLGTIEVKRKFALGRGTFTRQAWNKAFEEVSEQVVSEAVRKF